MNPTALIIDDEPEPARALARLLRLRGWSSILARTGEEARAILEQQTPDAIVVDVVGPVRPGIDLARELGTLAPQAIIIAMSGYTPAVLATIGVHVNAKSFLRKPFDSSSLSVFFPMKAEEDRNATVRMKAVRP